MNENTMTKIGWVASFLGVTGAILNILLIKECFLIWTVGNLWWIYAAIKVKSHRSQLLLFTVFTILNVWGFIQWGWAK